MTRPQIIRADTIDLQDQNAPSAKDHSRQPTHPSSLGEGPPGPSQAQALKAAGHDGSGIEFHASRSPRMSQDLSNKELSLLSDDASINEIDGTILGSRDGVNGEDGHLGGDDGDDGMDDDMMDKISSSPSIDDGGCPMASLPGLSQEEAFPILSITPTYTPPLIPPPIELSRVFRFMSQRPNAPYVGPSKRPITPPVDSSEVHHQGGYETSEEVEPEHESSDYGDEERDVLSPLLSEQQPEYFRETSASSLEVGPDDGDNDVLHGLLLPEDDPLLDNSFDGASLCDEHDSPTLNHASSSEWENGSTGSADDEPPSVSLIDDHHLDDRFIDSGWGGECLREAEDIDFEFVYALHTFAATVEGQANATKGDTMVLLDDSNSYWWLVRVVKDSSIGYLPAEHIETPTERLARLNKHRNIDLSQTMLGDNPEKSKNPLKKAMRRRNAKTVQFAPPTYHEAAEINYSSDEEDDDDPFAQTVASTHMREPTEQETAEQITAVEPVNVRGQTTDMNNDDIQPLAEPRDPEKEEEGLLDERPRSSEEIFERPSDELTGKGRRGLVRNTDSFFKDDTVETRKINLTPSLLREDSSSKQSGQATENKARGSIDILEKAAASPEKKEEKRKDKRSVLGGFFKRKDRKSKQQSDPEDNEWLSKEIVGNDSPQSSRVPSEASQDGQQASPSQQKASPQRIGSKLQKKNIQSTIKSTAINETQQGSLGSRATNGVKSPSPRDETTSSTQLSLVPEPLASNAANNPTRRGPPLRLDSSQQANPQAAAPSSPTRAQNNRFSPIRQVLSSNGSPYEQREVTARPEKPIPAKQRMPLDDSEDEDVATKDPFADRAAIRESQESTYSVQSDMAQPIQHPSDRLSESPVQVLSYQQGGNGDISRGTPGLVQDSSSQELAVPTPPSAPSTPELISHPQNNVESLRETPTSTSVSGQSPLPQENYAQPSLSNPYSQQPNPQNPYAHQNSFAQSPSYNQNTHTHHNQDLYAHQQEGQNYSPPFDPTVPSPSHPSHDASLHQPLPSHTPSPRSHTSSLPLWSDASLRTYLEDDTDIRDLLIVVHDKSDVGKVGKEHPLVRGMYGEERRRVSEMEGRLDGLLKGVLERRGRRAR